MTRVLSGLAGTGLLVLGFAAGATAQTAGGGRADVRQGRGAHPQQELRELPSAGRDRPDVVPVLRETRPVGALDQGQGRSSARCRRGAPTRRTA